MVLSALLLILLFPMIAYADTGFASTIRVSETDNSPACTVGMVKVSTGTLTCSGQVATITTGGASGTYVLKVGDSMSGNLTFTTSSIGPVLVDANSCTWRLTVNTSGTVGSTLVSCPSTDAILMEDSGYVLLEDGSSHILLE